MLVFAILLGFGAPLQDSDQADCVLQQLTPAQRLALAEEGAGLVRTGAFPPDSYRNLSPLPECMARNRWTPEQADIAARYTIAKLALPSAKRMLANAGIDTGRMDVAYRSLPLASRQHVLTRADAAAIIGAMGPAADSLNPAETGMVGRYVSLLNMIDAVPAMLGDGN